MNFKCTEHFPHVYHIGDAMNVYMTLITGKREALLIDSGYGLEDVQAFVRTLTPLPLTCVLTHAHHDHALGAMHLDRVYLHQKDQDALTLYTGTGQRKKVLEQAQAKGITPPEDFLTKPVSVTCFDGNCTMDLGGMEVTLLPCPGHTPGSLVVYIPSLRLLLSGDNWNPCTWLFFPEALGAREYLQNVRELFKLPFEHVLCSHQAALYPRSKMDQFFSALNEDALNNAEKVSMGRDTDTRQVTVHPDQVFVFDHQKFQMHRKEESV